MSENTITESQRKHLFALLGDAGIKNREDRLSFARTALDIDESNLASFTQLYEGEADDLIFAARAWKTIQSLRDLNGETLKSSISFVRRYYNYSRDDEAVAKVREDDAEERAQTRQKTRRRQRSLSVLLDALGSLRRPQRRARRHLQKRRGQLSRHRISHAHTAVDPPRPVQVRSPQTRSVMTWTIDPLKKWTVDSIIIDRSESMPASR